LDLRLTFPTPTLHVTRG